MKLLLPITLATLAATAHAADDVQALLKAADKWRLSSESMQVETQVQVFNKDGSPDKERRYTVFAQPQHKSLVLMRSPAEAGQKVLMLGDDFWLLMPSSQRPLRITPMQKLLGDASTGDIATLSWAEDYDGKLVGDEACGGPAPGRPQPDTPSGGTREALGGQQVRYCQHLSLQAQRKGVSYQRIELWLAKPRHEPVKADLYVQSDKLAKQAQFVLDGNGVSEMVLQDQLSSHKETRVRYLSRASRSVPEAWLNPMFLARNPALE